MDRAPKTPSRGTDRRVSDGAQKPATGLPRMAFARLIRPPRHTPALGPSRLRFLYSLFLSASRFVFPFLCSSPRLSDTRPPPAVHPHTACLMPCRTQPPTPVALVSDDGRAGSAAQGRRFSLWQAVWGWTADPRVRPPLGMGRESWAGTDRGKWRRASQAQRRAAPTGIGPDEAPAEPRSRRGSARGGDGADSL
jgi:hypothetical protein